MRSASIEEAKYCQKRAEFATRFDRCHPRQQIPSASSLRSAPIVGYTPFFLIDTFPSSPRLDLNVSNRVMSGRASMKRKQSSSILQALGKSSSRTSAIPITPAYSTPPTSASSQFPYSENTYSPGGSSSPFYAESLSSRAPSSAHVGFSRRSVSQSTTEPGAGPLAGLSGKEGREEKGKAKNEGAIRRPEDVFRVVKERLLSWSYMMQWYQGEVHWFNAVKVTRTFVESSIGAAMLERRARNFYVLGCSMAGLFDIAAAGEFLKALLKLLEEWEAWDSGKEGKGVRTLFRGQKVKKPIGSDISAPAIADGETYLLTPNLPFPPDFFQVHSSTCSIVRDVYKKILGMVLPARSGITFSPGRPTQPQASAWVESTTLFHPSTFIHSAPLESPFSNPPSNQGNNPKSPNSFSTTTTSYSGYPSASGPGSGEGPATTPNHELMGFSPPTQASSAIQQDAFQALVAGDLPSDRTLVGDGQTLTPQVVDLFLKVDLKLRKQFSTLLREGDAFAQRVLDEELSLLTQSLTAGAPLKFDYASALSSTGSGWYGASASGGAIAQIGLEGAEKRDRDYGSI